MSVSTSSALEVVSCYSQVMSNVCNIPMLETLKAHSTSDVTVGMRICYFRYRHKIGYKVIYSSVVPLESNNVCLIVNNMPQNLLLDEAGFGGRAEPWANEESDTVGRTWARKTKN